MDIDAGIVKWPTELVESYKKSGCWNGRTIGSYLVEAEQRYGDREALCDGNQRFSYQQLTSLSDALALNLIELGITKGDTAVIQLENSWQFVVALMGCLRLGVVPVLTLPSHRKHEISYFIEQVEAKVLFIPGVYRGFDHVSMALEIRDYIPCLKKMITTSNIVDASAISFESLLSCSDNFASARRQLDLLGPSSGDVALFLLSGGTTGKPKLIPRTHDDYGYNFRTSSQACGLSQATVYLTALPVSHNFPLACPGILGTFYSGGRVVLTNSNDPEKVLPLIISEKVDITAVVPAVAQRWIDAVTSSPDLAPLPLDVLQVGGARLAPELANQVRPVLGCKLQQVFGMAEGLINFTGLFDPEDVICRTQGRPMSPLDEVAVVDDDDNIVQYGQIGQLVTQGPYTIRGYFNAEEHNSASFTRDGWYRSGDVVRWDPSGNLVVLGRTKDLINRGGEKISAEEIENLIYGVAKVKQVAAVSSPDLVLGEKICAVVVLRDNNQSLSLEELCAEFVAFGVAKYKFPEQLVIVDELPLTNLGKIDKAKLRQFVAQSNDY